MFGIVVAYDRVSGHGAVKIYGRDTVALLTRGEFCGHGNRNIREDVVVVVDAVRRRRRRDPPVAVRWKRATTKQFKFVQELWGTRPFRQRAG